MRAYTDPADPRIVRALRYKDREEGTWEVILEREGLCSRAGCKCVEGDVVCNNFEYIYFDPLLYEWYEPQCYSSCGCRTSGPGTQTTSSHKRVKRRESMDV